MIVILRKWNLILLAAIIAAGTLTLGIFGETVGQEQAKPVFLPAFGKCVLIDAGHGDPDGGAVGSNTGVLEKDLNLKIALELQEFLEQGGTEVILTRSDDNGIYSVSGSISKKKVSDIKNREKLMNESGADLFISIHMNKFTQGQYSGPQVFYSGNHPESERFAKLMQQFLIQTLQPASERTEKKAGKDIYLLKNAKIPAILVECGFLSNAEEEKLLQDEEYQKKIAWAMYQAVNQYFSE